MNSQTTARTAGLALPLELDWMGNEGNYGDGGPDCRSGFRSPCIVDANGKTVMDTLNSDGAEVHEEHDGDDNGSWFDAWDEAGRKRVAFIVAAANVHDELVDCHSRIVRLLEDRAAETALDVELLRLSAAEAVQISRAALAKAGAL